MELIMRRNYFEPSGNIELDNARIRVHELKRFYIHLFIYFIAVALYIGKRYFGLPINFWPINFINEFFMWIWTFIVGIKAVKLFFRERFFGTKWEQQKIKKMMEEEQSKTTKWQ